MKKLLHKSCQWLLMLIAMLAMSFSASAQDVTINLASSTSSGGVTVSGGEYDSSNGYYSIAPGGALTVTANQAISKIVLTENSNGRSYGNWGLSVGTMVSYNRTIYEWGGSATSVVFTNTGTMPWNYLGLDKVEVWLAPTGPIEKPAFPVEGQAYQLKHNASGLYLNVVKDNDRGTVLDTEAQPLTFTWDATKGGFTIQNDVDLYVGSHSNDWNMSCSLAEYWTVEGTEGAYTLKRTGTAKYLNFNSPIAAGSAAFRDKDTGAVFSIEPYVAPTVYSYRVQFIGYPDGEAPNLKYDGLYYGQDDVVRKTNVQLTESDIQVTNIAGYNYEVAITHPQGEAYGQVLVTFTERPVNYFTIPAVAFRKDIDVTYDSDLNEVPTSMYFRVLASDVPGLDSFKYTGNGKQITARLTAEGAEPSNAYLTIYGSYDGTQASVKPFDLALADKAFSVTFPKGAFEAANGDLSDAFTYSYDPEANRVTYTFYFYNSDTSASVPADLAVVYANTPQGDRYTTGSNYVALYAPSPADFTSLTPYWEIDPQRSNVSGTNINLYFTQQPYKYYVTIEGNENAVVTVKGQDYSNFEAVETYTLLTATDVTYNDYRGYTKGNTQLQQPEDGKGGVIYVKYDAIQYAKATFDRANPATGEISLDNSEGLHYFSLYFKEDLTDSQSFDGIPAGVTMTDEKGTTYTLSNFGGQAATEWMSSCINIATEKLISAPGTYTLHIPAGIFYFGEKEDMVNDELDLVWTITARQHYDLHYSAVQTLGERMDPTNEWSNLKNLSGFEITLPAEFDAFMQGYNKLYIAPERGGMMGEETNVEELTEASGYSMSLVQGTNTIRVSFDQTLAPAEPTSYSYIIPAGAIRTKDGLTNKQISLSASVDPTVYFDLVVTYPAAGNAQAPVDHMVIELPEGLQVSNVDGTNIYFNNYSATVEKFEQNGRELTITFADHAAQAGDDASYYIPRSAIVGTDITAPAAVRMANSTAQQYNIPVTAAPVEYYVHFEGWPFETHVPLVTYNGENYAEKYSIIAADLTVDQLSATPADGYDYVITIEETGTPRVLVTYTAKAYAAVSSVSPAEGEISLDDNADGLGSITITMDGEAGWDADVYAGDGNPVPAGVKLLDPNGDEVTINDSYGFCMWKGSTQININHTPYGLKTPGQYTLIIPAGLNTIGGKENPHMEYSWTVKEATTFEFDRYYVQAIGDRNNDGVQLSLSGFTVALPENLSDCSTEVPGLVDLYITVSTGDEMSEEPAEPTLVTSTYSITDGVVTFTFPEAYTEKGRVSVTLNANNIGINGLSNKAFSTSFNVDPNPTQYIELASATEEELYTSFNEITEYSVTSNSNLWPGIVLDITAEMLADKAITISYYTQEEGTVNLDASVESVSIDNGVVTFQFTEPVTIPFDTWYSVIFSAGFITFDGGNIQSRTARFNNHKLVESYVYDVIYDETVPEGASLLQNGITIPVSKESFGGPVKVESSDFTATSVPGMNAVITVVQPTAEQPVGSITLSYETIEPISFNGQYTLNGTPSNLGEDFLCSLESITIPAPEGHTFLSADDCVLLIQGNTDTEYTHYESVTATISEDGSEVTITLTPAYSTPAFATGFKLAEGSLFLDNGADYIGFNCSVSIFPEYAFNIDHSDPADQAVIYNGELKSIDLYLPEGLSVATNGDLSIEVVGNGYVESFKPASIYGVNGQYVHVQLPESMDLPTGRITVTIPAGMLFYYDFENNDRLTVNAPYTLWIDNYSALQLVTEPAAGTVVGLDAIRVKGELGTLWSPNTDAETLAQSVHFGTYEGPVAVNTAIEDGVLVITPVETLAEGNYTLTIDGLAGTLESADVAASVNAPARFEFNVVGSTFAFQGAQPYDGKTISELTELETINLSFGWNVGNVRVSEQAGNDPIAVTLTDGDGAEQTIILTYPDVSESEWGGSVAQLVGKVKGSTYPSTADGKYNVSLTIPAGIFVSDNGRTNEAMTLHYVYDSNKYFAVSPNFESYGHVTGPVKTFTLTAAEGVTFTGIAPDKVADPENGVDRPTVFKGGSYLTWANPVISADGKSVTLTLADPISADSPYEQYYLVVPDGLFTGTLGTAEGVTFPATSTGFGAWQKIFYIDAPAYDHVEIAGPVENGESITSYGGYIYIYVNKSIGGDKDIPEGTTLTSADGQSVEIYDVYSNWNNGNSYFVVKTASNLQPGTYTLHVPADSRYADGVIDFTFTLVETFDLADGTFAPTGTVEAQTLESFTWTAPEGKTILSVDLTKIGNGAYDSNWNWVFTPLAGLTYEIAGEKNQVVFTLAEPITVSEGQTTASLNLSFQGAAIVCADGSMSKGGSYSVTIDPFPNDINRDGKEDNVDDAIAISDIILRNDGYLQNNISKADLNGDGEVTIGDLVKYIQQLQSQEGAED